MTTRAGTLMYIYLLNDTMKKMGERNVGEVNTWKCFLKKHVCKICQSCSMEVRELNKGFFKKKKINKNLIKERYNLLDCPALLPF